MIPPIKAKPSMNHDSHQTAGTFVVSIYTKTAGLTKENVIAELTDSLDLSILVQFPSSSDAFSLRHRLSRPAALGGVRVSPAGKVEVTLKKERAGEHWPALGEEREARLCKQADLQTVFRQWTLKERREVTHDVDHLVLEPPAKSEVSLKFS